MSQQNQIFVGNLSFSLDESGLKEAFEKFGKVIGVKIPTDRDTNKKRGFGFVTFDTDSAAREALTMDGQDLSGRTLRVSLAQGRKDSEGRKDVINS